MRGNAYYKSVSVFRSLCNALAPNPNAITMPRELLPPQGAIQIRLRPMGAEDEAGWNETRQRNAAWFAPWDSNDPMHGPGLTFNTWLQRQRSDEASGSGALFVIEYQMAIIGQISVGRDLLRIDAKRQYRLLGRSRSCRSWHRSAGGGDAGGLGDVQPNRSSASSFGNLDAARKPAFPQGGGEAAGASRRFEAQKHVHP